MTTPKKRNWWIWILSGLILLLIGAAIYKSKMTPKGVAVITEKAGTRDIIETVSASGKIYPETEIKISSDVSGEVVELYVKEGDSVRVGQVLARVNPDAYKSAVERGAAGVNVARSQAGASKTGINTAKAQRDQVNAQFQNAKKNLDRSKQLFKDGIISQSDLDLAETQYKNLESNLRSAESSIEAAIRQTESASYQVKDAEALFREQKTNLGRATIKAPASGIISKLNVEKGERVVGTIQMSGTELMRIADFNAMEVQVEVSENDIVRVNVGNETIIEVDAYQNKKFKGQVTEVSNSASNLNSLTGISTDQVTKFVVKVRIDKTSYADLIKNTNSSPFKPGMSATVEIKTNTVTNKLSIPIQAVTAYDPEAELKKKSKAIDKPENVKLQEEEKKEISNNHFKEAVYIKMGDTVTRKDVITGIQDQNYIQIIEGLNENDEVVIGPYTAISKDLKAGSKVYIKKEEPEKDSKKK